jgi:hypothetical protein
MRFVTNTFRNIRVRPRLSAATAIGIVLIVLLPKTIAGPTRALLAWDLGAGLYLGLAWTMMFRASVEKMRWRARIQDDGAEVILALTVVAAVASLAAILLELIGIKGLSPRMQTLHLGLAALTILLSWSFVHTAFALHYAHEFYDDAGGTAALPRFSETPSRLRRLPLLCLRSRHHVTDVGRDDKLQPDAPAGAAPWRHRILLQHHAAGADGEYRGGADLIPARSHAI